MDEETPKIIIPIVQEDAEAETTERGESVRLLSFLLNDVSYLVDIQEAKEVIPSLPWTRVPHTPEWVVGVINLRGNIIPLLDIRSVLHLEGQTTRKDNKFLISDLGGALLGVSITDVVKTVDVPKKLIEPPLMTLDKGMTRFISGQVRIGEVVQLIVSLRAILSSDMMKI